MKYGFKAQAERMSLEERSALELTSTCRLDPARLAAAKSLSVCSLSDLPGVPEADVRRLRDEDPKAFSALTVVDGIRVIIVINDGHTQERQANSLAHELAHVLLRHPAVPMLNEYGARTLTKEHENEADWLAGCLLVPGSGIAATMQSCGSDLELAAAHYGVSVELMRWRHNMTKPGPARQSSAKH
jgi:Zn-dependent peptidase ImmA (M78 family)